MDTAKVDIKKLQILNDRINQTIDALNQVRMSVHGLQSTPAAAISPWGGLSHTTFAPQAAVQALPLAQQYYGAVNPMVPQGWIPQAQIPQPFVGAPVGLSHTGYEAVGLTGFGRMVDPYTVARVAQTFPFAQAELAPMRALY